MDVNVTEERINQIWPYIEKKDPQALYEYGIYLEKTKGPQEALEYYVASAIKRFPKAAYMAGRIYATIPFLADKTRARYFLEAAKSRGIPEAELLLNKLDSGLVEKKKDEWNLETQKEYEEGKRTQFPIHQQAMLIINKLAEELVALGDEEVTKAMNAFRETEGDGK